MMLGEEGGRRLGEEGERGGGTEEERWEGRKKGEGERRREERRDNTSLPTHTLTQPHGVNG